jgi:hypothetical protein
MLGGLMTTEHDRLTEAREQSRHVFEMTTL